MPITISSINIEERRKLDLQAGDSVRVWQKITDRVVEKDKVKEKSRLQAFEGLVLARKHGREAGATFTVRRVVDGVGVERIFPLYAPTVDKIEILKRMGVEEKRIVVFSENFSGNFIDIVRKSEYNSNFRVKKGRINK